MLRGLFKLIGFLVLAALLYGLWSLYQEKTPEQKQEVWGQASRLMKEGGRTLMAAGRRVVEKGRQLCRQREAEEKEEE